MRLGDVRADPRPGSPAAVGILSPHRSGRLRAHLAIGLAIGLALGLAFTRLVDVNAAYGRLSHLEAGPALLCGVLFLGAYVVRAVRWRLFLGSYSVSIPRVIALYQVGIFVNWLLPIRGGELAKSLLLRRLNAIPMSRSLPAVAMDKMLDLLPAVGLVAILPFLQLRLGPALQGLLLSVLTILGLGVTVLLALNWRRQLALSTMDWLLRRSPALVRRRGEPFLAHLLEAFQQLVWSPRLLLLAVGYTAIAVCLDALFCLLAFRAVGVDIAFPVALYGYTMYNLAYIMPTPPGQIGSNEIVGLLVFSGLLGIDPSGVAGMFLFSHPWTALLMVSFGVFNLSRMGLTLGATLALAQDATRDEGSRPSGLADRDA